MKRQKAVLLALGLAATGTVNATDWVQGVTQGIDTIVTVVLHIDMANSDWEDSIATCGIERYEYNSSVRYPFSNLSYLTKWVVFIDQNGTYQYRKQQWINGVAQPLETTVFEVSASGGLPLTKRQWKCSIKNENIWYEGDSSSSLKLRMKHTVLKPATRGGSAPSNYKCEVYSIGYMWDSDCVYNPLGLGSWSWSGEIPRNMSQSVDYGAVNIEINDIYERVKL